jgi:hypothetical protein
VDCIRVDYPGVQNAPPPKPVAMDDDDQVPF